jgi:hypothetical protein
MFVSHLARVEMTESGADYWWPIESHCRLFVICSFLPVNNRAPRLRPEGPGSIFRFGEQLKFL